MNTWHEEKIVRRQGLKDVGHIEWLIARKESKP
jgi:hypothetical protein